MFYENNTNFNDICMNVCLFVCINSEYESVQLFKSYCLPFILHTTQTIPLIKSSIQMMDDCIK